MRSIVGKGLYAVPDAARLVGVQQQRVHRWFRTNLLAAQHDRIGGREALGFLNLVEVRVVALLRKKGVSLQSIRGARSHLAGLTGSSYPFAHVRLRTDGKTVFLHELEAKEQRLLDLSTMQMNFPSVLLEFTEGIEYDNDTDLAAQWRPAPGILIDPTRAFGAPLHEATGIATAVLAQAWKANNSDARLVAEWYEVPESAVEAAVDFEARAA